MLHAIHEVVGIDIGKVGNIALSTGFRMTVKTSEDAYELFRQIIQYNTLVIALEDNRHDKKKIKGLDLASNLITNYCKARTFGHIDIIYVDKFKSSIICSNCKFVDRESRREPWLFVCTYCGFRVNADVNAARNLKHATEDKLRMLAWD